MGGIGLILTCVGVWAAVSAVTEAKTANELAHWTSTKDFIEFCESHNITSCMGTQNTTLPPPPGFSLLGRWRRSLSINLWNSNSMPEGNQNPGSDIITFLGAVVVAICFFVMAKTTLRKDTYRQFTIAAQRALRRLTRLWAGNHSTGLPLARSTTKENTDLTENSDFTTQGASHRHRKPAARRRREARLDRFSRYRTTENNSTVVDDTSSDELYTHGEDTRRSRVRLRRRAKRVVNDENV
ncbi:hypothetical protein B0T21DRAFT_412049 [Apiosordaria backusii]|uniref:Uncharacterized protein n=1 Tax=Apiosordaria backusii TaxID=314023 RepID=A0AA40BJK4_9PEZI|nr:hypothetical protein B0T21DRAFT_412049 [Apiosordaria backusii]